MLGIKAMIIIEPLQSCDSSRRPVLLATPQFGHPVTMMVDHSMNDNMPLSFFVAQNRTVKCNAYSVAALINTI